MAGDTDDTPGVTSRLWLSLSVTWGRTAVRAGGSCLGPCRTSGPLCRLCLDSDHISHYASAGAQSRWGPSSGGRRLGELPGENSDIPGLKAELQSQELAAAPRPRPPSEGTQGVKINRHLQTCLQPTALSKPPPACVSSLIDTSAWLSLMGLRRRSPYLQGKEPSLQGCGSRPTLGGKAVTFGTGSRRYGETPTCSKYYRISELKRTSLEHPMLRLGPLRPRAGIFLPSERSKGHRVDPRKAGDGFLYLEEAVGRKHWRTGPLDRVGGCNERNLWEHRPQSPQWSLLQTSHCATWP